MKSKLTLVPKISIHPSRINFSYEPQWTPSRPIISKHTNYISAEQVVDEMENDVKKTKYDHLLNSSRSAEGFLSVIGKRKLLKGLEYLLLLSKDKTISTNFSGRLFKFRIAFVTLSLASNQIHSDHEIKKELLNQFLIEIKKKYKVRNYIWRAEKQKNGNIHFHLIIDKFIPWNELRNNWNRIQQKLGYVTRYREEQINWHKNGFQVRSHLLNTWPLGRQKEAYERGAKCHWHNPNSTDIHSVKNVMNVKNYISKYITKNIESIQEDGTLQSDKLKVHGRIWGCSSNLSDIKGAQLIVDNRIEEELIKIEQSKKFRNFSTAYFNITFIDFSELKSLGCDFLWKSFSLYLFQKFDFALNDELFSELNTT
jgi:hypothetical protein